MGMRNITRRRKRLGQFNTGAPLARLLAALGQAERAHTIIDPMGGSGDLLAACLNIGAFPERLAAIEIDPDVVVECRIQLSHESPRAAVVTGSAFDRRSWKDLPDAWDLVITNPPYVRYQNANHDLGSLPVPGAEQVRAGLLDLIDRSTNLDDPERSALRQCARHYSGHADLAVPSLLLCAMRVADGGHLAVVVPETWLTRDYTMPVLYVLRRFFEIEHVIGDADGSWFDDALVRTNLIVARRVPDKRGAAKLGGHLRTVISRGASDQASLVGRAFPACDDPETRFAGWADRIRATDRRAETTFFKASWSDETDLIQILRQLSARKSWLRDAAELSGRHLAPERIRSLLGAEPPELVSLENLGWVVGQGMRTGANDFFYVKRNHGESVSSPILPHEELDIPESTLRDAVRSQADLPNSGRIVTEPHSQLLVLDDHALPEDIEAADGPSPWQAIEGDLARLVRRASEFRYERAGRRVRLPELSAVRTNVRRYNPLSPEISQRFWYSLPALANRHQPELYMARVNGSAPTAYLNPKREFVIDANFSTFWRPGPSVVPEYAMLALLSSTWVHCSLELIGTVMGGGALKIEATHLRRLLVPLLSDDALQLLNELGERQAVGDSDAVRPAIDDLVFAAVGPTAAAQEAIATLASDQMDSRGARDLPPEN